MKKKFYGHSKFIELIIKEIELHSEKTYNYSKEGHPLENFYVSEEIGIPAPFNALNYILGKNNRVRELLFKEDLVGEPITDACLDGGVYSKLFIILWKEFLKNKNAKEILKLLEQVRNLLKNGKEI